MRPGAKPISPRAAYQPATAPVSECPDSAPAERRRRSAPASPASPASPARPANGSRAWMRSSCSTPAPSPHCVVRTVKSSLPSPELKRVEKRARRIPPWKDAPCSRPPRIGVTASSRGEPLVRIRALATRAGAANHQCACQPHSAGALQRAPAPAWRTACSRPGEEAGCTPFGADRAARAIRRRLLPHTGRVRDARSEHVGERDVDVLVHQLALHRELHGRADLAGFEQRLELFGRPALHRPAVHRLQDVPHLEAGVLPG